MLCLLPVAVIAAGAVYARISDHLFHRRAEMLLRQIHWLEAGKATWADVAVFRSRWEARATASSDCSAAACDLEVHLNHTHCWLTCSPVDSVWTAVLCATMRPDASWSASVTATVAIRNGTVSAKGFQVMVAHRQAYAVMAEVQIVSEPGLGGAGLRIGCNSEAAFLQTEGSDGVWVEVTPNAAPGEQDRAFAFDLSCLDGSGRGCTKAAQLLPAVAQCVRDGLDGSEHPLRNTQTPGVQGRH